MDLQKNNTRVRHWINTLENKTDMLRSSFGVTAIFGFMCLLMVLALAKYNFSDILIVSLLVYSLIGCVPYIEVATIKNNNTFSADHLTIYNWRKGIQKNTKYNILSSNIHFLHPIFPVITILSFLLFTIHKIFGDKIVNVNTVILVLIIQIPFNNFLGLNPLGVFLTRQTKSKFINQNNLKTFLFNGNASARAATHTINQDKPFINEVSKPKNYGEGLPQQLINNKKYLTKNIIKD